MRLNKSAVLLSAFCVALAAFGFSTPASADVLGLKIGAIGYNAYGADAAANRNSEYVDVVNDSAPAADIPVVGLVLQDAWAHGNNARYCNTFTLKAGVLPVDAGATVDALPSGRTLRIYLGSGTPRVFTRDGVTYHAVYANSRTNCGYNGHIFNNGPSSNRYAPWDTAWITLGGMSESKGYNFSFGYVAK